jgi:putative acetyltransferase
MPIYVRKERTADLAATRNINNLAFGREEEGRIADNLRESNSLTLSLVAVYRPEPGGQPETVGHIAFSPIRFEPELKDVRGLCLGPVAVLPEFQRQGVGSRLVKEGLRRCGKAGYDLVVLTGHPSYYPRFGFVQSRERGIECEYSQAPDDAWMLIELRPGALAGRRATAFFRPEFREGVPE